MNVKGKIEFIGQSHPGKVRPHNEDAIGTDLEAGLVVLADGMGGYKAGEVASAIAIQTVTSMIAEGIKKAHKADAEVSGFTAESLLLRDAIVKANEIIHHTSKTQAQCEGMGTTIVACLYFDNRVSIAHVGDSRMYRLRKDTFEQLTMDHSLLQELVDRGFYSQEEAQRATNKNYVTRALGVEATVDVEVHELPVEPGDWLVLCSDGLHAIPQ